MRSIIYILLTLAICGTLSAEEGVHRFELNDAERQRSIPILLRLPSKTSEPFPVILLSHGLGGSREGLSWLGKPLAAAGMVVIHMQHPGSDQSLIEGVPRHKRLAALKQGIGVKQTLDRLADVTTVLNALESWNQDPDHAATGKLDLQKVAIAGHSYGAVTTQAMLGQQFRGNLHIKEPRLKAGLALSPSPGKSNNIEESFGSISRPFMCITGTADTSAVQPQLQAKDRLKVYAGLPPGAAYQAIFSGAKHGEFSDYQWNSSPRQKEIQTVIVSLAKDFFHSSLHNDVAARDRLQQQREDIAAPDSWEWK